MRCVCGVCAQCVVRVVCVVCVAVRSVDEDETADARRRQKRRNRHYPKKNKPIYKYFRQMGAEPDGKQKLLEECRAAGISTRASVKTLCRRLAKAL